MKELIYTFWMLVGTYTGSGSEGIYVYGFNPETARTEYVGMARVDNPSYLVASADGSMVYAVSENGDGALSLANAFAFDRSTGELTFVNSVETSGAAPCNIATGGQIVATANYGGGDVSVFGLNDGGSLSPLVQTLRLPEQIVELPEDSEVASTRIRRSHMHCVKFSPDGRFLFAADLGTDKILRWDVSADGATINAGSLVTFDLPRGSGPRHFVFDGKGRNLYLINEIAGTVVAFRYNDGDLQPFQTVLADTAGGHGSADVALTPDGRWFYASNRLKNDGVAIFAVAPDGTLSPAGYRATGVHPRNLSIAPDGDFLLAACRDSDSVEAFGIDPATGALTPTDHNVTLDAPVCVVFIPAMSH